jgi:hypothetical protein
MVDIPKFKSSVEISRKWDGGEVAIEITQKIKRKIPNPKFILLFVTIQYENEFEKILKGMKEEFPDVPLIGGTIAGFMTQEGCYTRGVSALAVEYPNMNVSIGIGRNTKRNPKKAVSDFAEMIKQDIVQSKYSDKLLFVLISGSMVPNLPGIGEKKVIKTNIPSSVVSRLLKTSMQVSQKGVGREDKIMEEISRQMPDFNIIGGSSIDDNKMEKNFQFFNDEIVTNAVVGLSIETDMNVLMDSQVGVEKTDKIFGVNTAGEKYLINKIDKKPATKTFFESLNWPESLMDERLHRRTFFYPILFEKNEEIFPEVIGVIVGNSIVCGFDVLSDKLCIGKSSGKILENAIRKGLQNITRKGIPEFSLIIYCSAFLETLGRDFFLVQKIIKEAYKDSPFLLISTGGEDFRIPDKIPKHSNETINTAAFSK